MVKMSKKENMQQISGGTVGNGKNSMRTPQFRGRSTSSQDIIRTPGAWRPTGQAIRHDGLPFRLTAAPLSHIIPFVKQIRRGEKMAV